MKVLKKLIILNFLFFHSQTFASSTTEIMIDVSRGTKEISSDNIYNHFLADILNEFYPLLKEISPEQEINNFEEIIVILENQIRTNNSLEDEKKSLISYSLLFLKEMAVPLDALLRKYLHNITLNSFQRNSKDLEGSKAEEKEQCLKEYNEEEKNKFLIEVEKLILEKVFLHSLLEAHKEKWSCNFRNIFEVKESILTRLYERS